MNKSVVIIRGNPENHDKSRMEQYIQQNQIEVLGDWFYDYRSDDSDWAFERYEDRLVCLKGVERNINLKGKISGRKSYLEKDPELVRTVRKLRMSKYTNTEITKILFDLGYKTKTGKPFGCGMITRFYQQSELLPTE